MLCQITGKGFIASITQPDHHNDLFHSSPHSFLAQVRFTLLPSIIFLILILDLMNDNTEMRRMLMNSQAESTDSEAPQKQDHNDETPKASFTRISTLIEI